MISVKLSQRSDLNKLSQSCKDLRDIVLPVLYRSVLVMVPMQWSRLPSLEGLLSSSGSNLQFTTNLFTGTQLDPLASDQSGDSDQLSSSVSSHDEASQELFVPKKDASNALNALVRLLILRIPKGGLESFR